MTKIGLLPFLYLTIFTAFTFANENIPYEPQTKNNYHVGASLDYQRVYNHGAKWINKNTTQDNMGGLSLIFGYKNLFDSSIQNNDFSLDIEGRITKSLFEESYANLLGYSVFIKPQYKFYKKNNDIFQIYGLLGFGHLNIEGYNGDVPADKNMIGKEIYSDISFQWGIGVSTYISKDLSLFLDYTSLLNDADMDSTLYYYDSKVYKELSADSINIGLIYKFNFNN